MDIRVPVGLPIPEIAAFVRRCEEAGFSGVGIHDHQHSGRDVYVTLALAAQQTSRIRLYPATSNPVTRHPAVLASLAHSLEELAPGRVQLTLAPGFLAVRNIGQRRARVDELREAVVAIKRLLAGEGGLGQVLGRGRRAHRHPDTSRAQRNVGLFDLTSDRFGHSSRGYAVLYRFGRLLDLGEVVAVNRGEGGTRLDGQPRRLHQLVVGPGGNAKARRDRRGHLHQLAQTTSLASGDRDIVPAQVGQVPDVLLRLCFSSIRSGRSS